MVVGVPVIQEEVVLGAIRAEASKSDVTARVARAWALIAGLGIGAILLSAIFAARRAKRVALPLVELEAAALRIGDGDFTSATPRSGIKEIDGVAQALDVTASRLGNALERERSFSADASHQLRTPITALQVTLEGALISGRITAEVLEQALQETERLTNTVDDLLVLARDTHGERVPMEVAKLLDTIEAEWHGPMASVGRALRVRCDTDVPCIYVSGSAIRHVISVLIANGVDHGDGEVTLHARRVPDGVAIDVSDIGPGFRDGGRDAFVRRSGRSATRGIGLALARSLSEAEGGRLVITQAGAGPTVSLLLPERGN